MSKGARTEAPNAARKALARDLCATIERLDLDGPPALSIALPALHELLGLDCAVSYRMRIAELGYDLDFFQERGTSIEPHFRRQVAGMPGWKGFYDPGHPEPKQRNRVLVHGWSGLSRKIGATLVPSGLNNVFQIRALLCSGPSMLGWVGGFRRERPTDEDVRLFTSIVHPMVRRLDFEQRLGDAELWRAGLAAALEALPLPAWVVASGGHMKHANALGRARLDRSKGFVAEAREAIAGAPNPAFRVTALSGRGLPPCYLVVEHRRNDDVFGRAARARLEWKLTAREAEVLELLAAGESTKLIADKLRCAMRTVEAHATQVFRKGRVGNRAALIVKFWSS